MDLYQTQRECIALIKKSLGFSKVMGCSENSNKDKLKRGFSFSNIFYLFEKTCAMSLACRPFSTKRS
jgi:hypothetical protein